MTVTRHPYPARVVALVALAVVAGLLLVAPAYGFHRDELFFIVTGRHPALGYVDQPPLTPLLTAGAVGLLGLEPLAIRILPALAIAACVALAAGTARELGGSTRAQWLAAVVLGTSGFLAAGHLASTTTFDLLAWSAILFLVTRLLAGGDPRLWLLVGLLAGIGLMNKHLVLFLGFGLAVGLLVHRRDLVRTRWPWLALGIAVVVWAPNLAWQAANGFPQLEMARRIAGDGAENRVMLVPELLLLAGPLLFPISLAGLVALQRDPMLRPGRPLATAFLAIFVLVLVSGGKSYYVAGALPPLMAAGAIVADRWLARGRPRPAILAATAAASVAVVALLTLPVLPAAVLATTPIPDIYGETAEQVGWPELARTVEAVVDRLPPDERSRAVILTGNYGEYGALALLGHDLPPVYSGHNALWDLGPPPDDRTVVVLVGGWSPEWWGRALTGCRPVDMIRNDAGMPNEEQGFPVSICGGMHRPWSTAWPAFRHLD